MSFVSDGYFREADLKLNFSLASLKSNYVDIFSFSNKLKFVIVTFAQSF